MSSFSRNLLVLAVLGCSAGERTPSADTTAKAPLRADSSPASDAARTAGSATVDVFYIAIEGAGSGEKIGCGDAVKAVTVDANGTRGPLRFALEKLLASRESKPAGTELYNALHQTALTIDSATVRNGEAIVGLSGKFSYGGVCDAPRIEAQLTRTATQFPTVRSAAFYINGKPLRDLLSER